VPAIMVTGGPQLNGRWGDKEIGAGTDGRKLYDLYRPVPHRPHRRRTTVRDRRRHLPQRRPLQRDGHPIRRILRGLGFGKSPGA
jgi:hypothetical protein